MEFVLAQVGDDGPPRSVELFGGSWRAPTGYAVGLLDQHDREADGLRSTGSGLKIRRMDTATSAVP